jgi:L-alanine-DL-glutamate epimerase-like enolase superfamily enzyme
LRRELVEDEFELVDGRIPLPTAPGLGLRLNEAALEEFRVR